MAVELEPQVLMRRVAAIAAAAAAVALAIPAIQHLREAPPPPPPAVRLSLTAPAGTELGAADEPLDAAISPDQREVVFVATQLRRSAPDQAAIGSTQLWRRRLDAAEAGPIAGTDGARLPAWKQTGNVLSFFTGARLKLLNLKTNAVTDVTEAPAPAGATWLRDGSLLFVPAAGPVRRLLDGRLTDATHLAAGDTAHAFPVTTADGQDFTYVAIRGEGRPVVRLNSAGRETELSSTATPASLPDPRWLLFVGDDTLLAEYRDGEGRLSGRAEPLALEVGTTPGGRGLFVASADLLLHARRAERPRRISWLDMGGALLREVADVGDYWQVRVSPDDRSLAVTAREPLLHSLDVLNVPVEDIVPALKLTTSVAADSDGVWSPDGRQLAFRSMKRGRPEIFVTPAGLTPVADGQDSAPALNVTGELPTDWHGSDMLIQQRGKSGFDLMRADARTGNTTPVANGPFNETDGRWSPDGRWIAYVSDEPGRPDVYVHTDRGERQRVSLSGGTHPRWTRDGRALLFLRGSTIMRADLNAAAGRFGAPHPLFDAPGIRDFDLAHRSDRIVALLPVRADPVEQVSVVLNWRSLLRTPNTERRTPNGPRTRN
jgi:hypothetical protein